MLRPASIAPQRGWRRTLYRASLGTVNVGPGPAERRERELAARVKTPVNGSRRIVVLSRKGGVGKTTTTLMLGHTFASWRGDRVVALDGNPDAGSLAYRVRRETSRTVTGLLDEAQKLDRYADIRAFTSQAPTRLEIVASDDDPLITQALGEADYHRAINLLDRHYNLILLDTGTGILDSAIQGILKEADQLVVVMPPALDGARVAASTLDWLDQHGYGYLVRSAVAVINSVRRRGLVEVERVEQHFSQRCAATIRIPWDAHLEAGAQSGLDDLRPATREAYLRLAASVADGFATRRPQDTRR
jgi:putative peptide zinc metalloprotease protein